MPENRQKIKLLQLWNLLLHQSDEQHPLTTKQILQMLEDLNISCERRTLSKDIDLLNEEGFEVLTTFIGNTKAYYVEDRQFSIPELQILIDAIKAAQFLTPKKTEELAQKIASLAGVYRKESLQSGLHFLHAPKHSNETIYYAIDALNKAINEKKQASFFYFDLDQNKVRIYRKNKKRYIVDPLALTFQNNNYYLIAFSAEHEGLSHYRIDRMAKIVKEETEQSLPAQQITPQDLTDHYQSIFRMYSGKVQTLHLRFEKDMLGVIFDRFGEKIEIIEAGDNQFEIEADVAVSVTFFGWLCQFQGKIQIVEPQSIQQEYCDFLQNNLKSYL